jgi:hypothetical protein
VLGGLSSGMSAFAKRAWVKWTAAAVVAIVLGGTLVWWMRRCPADLGTLVEITCSHQPGNLTGDYSWELTVAADGKGTMVTNHVPRTISAPKIMQEFKETLDKLRLCDLPAQIGDPVVDGSWDLMTIKMTHFEKTIGFGYVAPGRELDRDIVEAQKLWVLAKKVARGPTAPRGPQP